MRLFIGDIRSRAKSIDNDVVDHTQIAHVCVVTCTRLPGLIAVRITSPCRSQRDPAR